MPKEGLEVARPVLVWDLPTRLFHWSLAALVATAFVAAKTDRLDLHFLCGYAILGLLLFRLAWGFIGSETARFGAFLRGPRAALAHLAELVRPAARPPMVGHNPLGGWMVLALLVVATTQAVTGLFTSDDVLTEGPLVAHASAATVKLLSSVHRIEAKVILGLVVLHLAAVLAYRLVWREDLVRPMLTGVKMVPTAVAEPRRAGLVRAALAFVLAAAAVTGLVLAA